MATVFETAKEFEDSISNETAQMIFEKTDVNKLTGPVQSALAAKLTPEQNQILADRREQVALEATGDIVDNGDGTGTLVPAGQGGEDIYLNNEPEDSTIYIDSLSPPAKMPDPELDANDSVMAVAIAAGETGSAVSDGLLEYYSTESPQRGSDSLEAARNFVQDNEAREFDILANEVPLNQPNSDVFEDLRSIQEAKEEHLDRLAVTEIAFIEAIASPERVQGIKEQVAADMMVGHMSSQIVDDMDGLDWVRNIFGFVVPGKQLYENISLTGSPLSSGTVLEKFIYKYRSMTPQEQVAALPGIRDHLLNELPELRASGFLAQLSQPNPDLFDFNAALAFLDAAEVALLAGKIVGTGVKLFRAGKAVKQIANLGDKKDAAKIVATALIDKTGDVAKKVGLSTDEVVDAAVPMNIRALDETDLKGLDSDIIENLVKYELEVGNLLQHLDEGTLFNREGVLTESEKALGVEKYLRKYSEKHGIENVDVVGGEDKFIITYDRRNTNIGSENQPVERIREEIAFDLDRDTGVMTMKDPGILGRHWKSALSWSKGTDMQESVRGAERLDAAQALLHRQLSKFHNLAIQSITGSGLKGFTNTFNPAIHKKINQLNDVLLAGDAEETTYTAHRLMHEGVGGIILDKQQVEAYFKIRQLVDALDIVRNGEARRELVVKGFKNVRIAERSGEGAVDVDHVARPFLDAEDAINSVRQSKSANYYLDEVTGVIKRFDLDRENGLDLENVYREGKVLVKLDKPKKFNDSSTKVKYALVDSKKVDELPERVVQRLEGYIPKINDQAAYFAKVRVNESIDGVEIAADSAKNVSYKTVRAFSTRKEADAYVDALNLEARQEGRDATKFMATVLEDNQLEKERMIGSLDDARAYTGGRLYTSPRATEEVLWGAEGVAQPRVNALDALSRNINSVSRYATRNEHRLGMEERALKTGKYLLTRDTGGSADTVKTFDDLRRIQADTANGRIINQMVKQVDDWNSVPTAEERFFKGIVQGTIDSAIGDRLPGFAVKGLHSLKSTDPIGSARAAAFHGLLGWFNPVQLWTQAQGMAVAVSMNILDPVELGRVFHRQTALQMLQHVEQTPKNIAHVAKALKMDVDELTDLNRAWRSSGLEDAVLTTADHAAASRGHGISMSALKDVADKGLMFYRPGELINRRVSFVTSYRRYAKDNAGKAIDAKGMKKVLEETNNMMLNMGKANRASWQKGILSLPTQFGQVNARAIETILGMNGNFTAADRGKIMLGQVALYGAAGVPIVGGLGSRMLMDAFGVDNQADLEKHVSPERIKFVNEGALGWMTMAVLGVDYEIGNRSAMLGGTNRFLQDFMFTEGSTADKVLGAFGAVRSRFWEGLLGKYQPISLSVAENTPLEPVAALTAPFLGALSTFRNVDKAIFMHYFNRTLDKSGNTLIQGDLNLADVIMTGIGFRNNREITTYTLESWNRALDEYHKTIAVTSVGLIHQYIMKDSLGNLTEDDKKEISQQLALLVQPLPPRDRTKVRNLVLRKLTNDKSREGEAWTTWHRNNQDGLVDQLFDINRSFGDNLQRAIGDGAVKREGVYDKKDEE